MFDWIISWKNSIVQVLTFNNHVKVQICESLVDVIQHTTYILFTYYYQFDQNPQ